MGRPDTNASHQDSSNLKNNDHQTRSPTSDPQVFPPSDDHQQPQAFPPSDVDHEKPQPFPPQAFPPPDESEDNGPKPFPPSDDHQQPQAFPPQAFPPHDHDNGPHLFPPSHQGKPQPFPPPQQPLNGMHFKINNGTPDGFPFINPNQIIQVPGQWKTGLFGCMDDPTNALITVCFPCVTFGQIAEIIDSGQTSCGTNGFVYGMIACCIAMPCLISCNYRTKLRARLGLIETPAPDCIIHCFCECCALCQEYRELKQRGVDPSLGWIGNVTKQHKLVQLAAMTPPMQQNMMC